MEMDGIASSFVQRLRSRGKQAFAGNQTESGGAKPLGENALHFAAWNGHKEVVMCLLQAFQGNLGSESI